MQTIEEYKEYAKQLEGEVKQWHDAFDASQAQVKELTKENLRLERERVEQNSIIETCANELKELRLHEVEWDLTKTRIKELEAEKSKIDEAFNAYQHGDKKNALKEFAQVGAVVLRCMEFIQKEMEAET